MIRFVLRKAIGNSGQRKWYYASGVIIQKKGLLFTGHGRAGKTTIANLFHNQGNATIVNDDKVLVRKSEKNFQLYGTPWHGDGGYVSPESAPLEKVFILTQAKTNFIKPLKPAQAVGLLLARSFLPMWDDAKVSFSLGFLESLCNAVPCFELGFLPNVSVVDFVLNLDY